ncbi:MAG: KilA-N domain-containing protein [Phaeodactylibacter sp.]|nr:KilA-N domain-containing protein [Phaeodactylibacter sp.]MCB9053352.1 KilA-N domain-containing protein [Lewinellaceae bacterium]
MSDITKFKYEDQQISFEFADGNKMINATEMAKPFSKPVGNFLRLKETKKYIALLEERYSDVNIGREVLRVVKGGDASEGLQGTWMDEKLALKFAAWLSPRFELWVYDRIQELLTTGRTEITGFSPSGVIKGLRMIAQQKEEQEKFNTEIRDDVDFIRDRIDELESKIISVDDHYYTIAGYCNLKKIPCPLHKAKEWGKAATALSRQRDIATGTAHDERFGKVRTYHEDILKEVVG